MTDPAPRQSAVTPLRRAAATFAAVRGLRLLVLIYLAGIVVAEACAAFIGVAIAVLAEALIVLVSLNHYLFAARRSRADAAAVDPLVVLLVIPLVPLLRILSVTMNLPDVQELYQYSITGIPVLVATVLAARTLQIFDFRRRLVRPSEQFAVIVAGIPLGFGAYAIARPEPVHGNPLDIVVGSAGLVIFSATTEELLFRGVLLATLSAMFGRVGVVLSVALFTSAYLGTRPLAFIIFAAVLGALYSWYAASTHSLVGVVVSHSIVSVSAVVIWPLVLG